METPANAPKQLFRKKHIHLYLIAIIPTVLSAIYFQANSEHLTVTSMIDHRAFIRINQGFPEVIYNLNLVNNTNSVVVVTKIEADLAYPFPSSHKSTLVCDSMLENLHTIDFDSFSINSKSAIKKSVILNVEGVEGPLLLTAMGGNNPLIVGKYHLFVQVLFDGDTKPLKLKYTFYLTDKDICKLNNKSSKKRIGTTIRIHLSPN